MFCPEIRGHETGSGAETCLTGRIGVGCSHV